MGASAEDRSVFEIVPEPPDDTWRYGPLADQVADVYLPDSDVPDSDVPDSDVPDSELAQKLPVVLVHGGYWREHYDRMHLRALASALAHDGRLVVSLEFRRIPGNPDATVHDLELALDRLPLLLATHGYEAFALAGHSAGGHLALLLAHRSTSDALAGCVALAPVADLVLADELDLDDDAVRAFLGVPARERPDLDPARQPAPDVPVRVLHGLRDSLVPVGVADAYCAATGIRLDELADCAHFELIDPRSNAWPHLLTALDGLSAPADAAPPGAVE